MPKLNKTSKNNRLLKTIVNCNFMFQKTDDIQDVVSNCWDYLNQVEDSFDID